MFADDFDYLIKSFQGESFWNFRHFLRNFEAFPRLLPGWFTLKSFCDIDLMILWVELDFD